MSACSAALVATAFNWFSCPLFPRPPSPEGKGEIYSYLMQGAPPLASPGLEPGRHWGQGANYVLGGRCAFLVSGCHCLPLAFLLPIPPTALAERSSPAGKGEIFSLFCRGLRPRRPGLNLRGTGAGASPVRSGRLAPASSARRALSFAFAPYPPTPFPGGEGGDF